MTTKQLCNDCSKQPTCSKAEHFENYSFDICSDFLEKNVDVEENDDEEGVQAFNLEG